MSELVKTLFLESSSISQVQGSSEHMDLHGQIGVNDVIKLDCAIFLCISCDIKCSDKFFYNGYGLLHNFFTFR